MTSFILGCIFAKKFKKLKVMARPIKETPILYGEDARRFEERMKEKRHEDPEKRAKRLRDYEMIMKIFEG